MRHLDDIATGPAPITLQAWGQKAAWIPKTPEYLQPDSSQKIYFWNFFYWSGEVVECL